MRRISPTKVRSAVSLATAYAKQPKNTGNDDENLVIPEDLTTLSDEELSALTTQAREVFTALYNDGTVSVDDMPTLEGLAAGIESLDAEQGTRDEATAERATAAAALAARAIPGAAHAADTEGAESGAAEGAEEGAADEGAADEVELDADGNPIADEVVEEVDEPELDADGNPVVVAEVVEDPQAIAAAASVPRREVRVNLSNLSSRQSQPRPVTGQPLTMRDVVMAAPDVPGFSNGQGMDFADLGVAVDSRLTSFNQSTYERAAAAGKHLRQQFGVATIRKPFAEGLRIDSTDPEQVERVFAHATDEKRLAGGTLVASGGWCAPSETLYDLFETESRDGLFSLPEVNIARGGIKYTQGPDFATLYSEITGFSYTEANDIAGNYAVDADGVGTGAAGSKPCYKIDCPDFVEARLGLDGLCLTAGLLQSRGYPEFIARIVRGALVAHDHRMSARKIAALVAGSDAVAMPADQVGALAPILTAIELQVEHYRDVHRLARSTSLEAVFPFWVHGAIRSDLSRRLGVDLIAVPDSRINAWFASMGINAQFVYNWQGASAGKSSAEFTSWATSVSFLLYQAGTWVGGSTDVITLDTVYDSTLLGDNDYTALFTEEGWLTAKRGHDSRVVTVPICPSGATGAGEVIECDGSAAPVA